jgi:hypothetical protein
MIIYETIIAQTEIILILSYHIVDIQRPVNPSDENTAVSSFGARLAAGAAPALLAVNC